MTTQYDLSVRTSIGGVVQFTYGNDALDPACMETEVPVEFERAWKFASVRNLFVLHMRMKLIGSSVDSAFEACCR